MARPIAIDLFAGAGGMSLGFEQAGFDVRAVVELDPIHCAVHEYNFPDSAVLCGSVATLSAEAIRQAAGIEATDAAIDVLFGGPPCQGFSLMGKRLLDDPRNQLVSHFIRLVGELQPRYFVMENVKGMASGKHRQLLAEALDKLDFLGYGVVTPYQVLNAAHYGVPQSRERLFLLGYRHGEPPPRYPAPTTRPAKSKRLAKSLAQLPPSPTVRAALQDLPTVEDYPELLREDAVRAAFGRPSDYGGVLRGTIADPENFGYPRPFDRQLLASSRRSRHGEKSVRRFQKTQPGETEPVSRFLKLDPEGVCNTLRAGTPSSRGAFTSPRPIHPWVPRCITVREAARLHSYPDWFRFHVTKWHGFRQIGNSVPPLLARAVARSLVEAMEYVPTAPEKILELGDPAWLSLTMTRAADRYGVSSHAIAPRQRMAGDRARH